jgi:hypothetical protein
MIEHLLLNFKKLVITYLLNHIVRIEALIMFEVFLEDHLRVILMQEYIPMIKVMLYIDLFIKYV